MVGLLMLLSVIATTAILYRLILQVMQREGTPSADVMMAQLRGNAQDPRELSSSRAPRIKSIQATWNILHNRSMSNEQIRSEVYRQVRNQIQHLSSGLRVLEVIATVAPLLGLFGTVLGMIEAFRAMEAAGSQVDPSALSGGIWQALLTTAVGLGVAIPVSLIHSYFERRNENLSVKLLSDAEELLNQASFRDAGSQAHTLKAVGQ